jgi:ribosomal protein L25 (general stress protein Ctc)
MSLEKVAFVFRFSVNQSITISSRDFKKYFRVIAKETALTLTTTKISREKVRIVIDKIQN